jgi:hypothetical protein
MKMYYIEIYIEAPDLRSKGENDGSRSVSTEAAVIIKYATQKQAG